MTFLRLLGSPPPSGPSRSLAVAVALAMGFGAIGGGISLLRDAEGFGIQEAWLAGSPFSDYRVPGWFLALSVAACASRRGCSSSAKSAGKVSRKPGQRRSGMLGPIDIIARLRRVAGRKYLATQKARGQNFAKT